MLLNVRFKVRSNYAERRRKTSSSMTVFDYCQQRRSWRANNWRMTDRPMFDGSWSASPVRSTAVNGPTLSQTPNFLIDFSGRARCSGESAGTTGRWLAPARPCETRCQTRRAARARVPPTRPSVCGQRSANASAGGLTSATISLLFVRSDRNLRTPQTQTDCRCTVFRSCQKQVHILLSPPPSCCVSDVLFCVSCYINILFKIILVAAVISYFIAYYYYRLA